VHLLKEACQKPKRKQFECSAQNTVVDEAVSEGLPESAVQKRTWEKAKDIDKPFRSGL
jgi:hypothetical protein